MKIAVLGYGLQGQAAYEYWKSGNEITICDRDENIKLPKGVAAQLGPDYLKILDRFDLIVRSPGVHPRDIVEANNPYVMDKVTTVTNEFFRVCPSRNIIGVTGTKGKGTTSTLIANMLEADGKNVHLGGNIGTPPLTMLKENIGKDDWVVLELASFQLIDLKYSPRIAVCLMVVPEHQDWHKDMDEYLIAKQQMFTHQNNDDVAIYNANDQNSTWIASASPGIHIPYMSSPGAFIRNDEIVIDDKAICRTDEVKLLGKHNLQNICAAVTAVWQITQNKSAIHKVISNFKGLEHRLEPVRELHQIHFFNDSFAATPEAAAAAINAIPGKKVMIMGGYDRALDLTNLVNAVMANQKDIRKLLLIGASGPRLVQELRKHTYNNYVLSNDTEMSHIVGQARSYAIKNDNVVLSPGFPSFDMFKNFEERGQKYKAAVKNLK